MGGGMPRVLGEARAGPTSVLSAVRHARTGHRRTMWRLPARRSCIRLRALPVSLHRPDAWHSSSPEILRPDIVGETSRASASRSHGRGRISWHGGFAGTAAPIARTATRVQPGRAAGATSEAARALVVASPAQEHAKPDRAKPFAADDQSVCSVRGSRCCPGVCDRGRRCIHNRIDGP